MDKAAPDFYQDYETTALKLIEKLDKKIVIGVPLGLGKPIGLLNALYRFASADPTIHLTIITGLTLSRPTFHNILEENLARPILDRLLDDYQDPLYEIDRVKQVIPSNIRVVEFFFSPGKYLHNHYAQQHYICSSYTDVVRDATNLSINVLAQAVAKSEDGSQYSLSCNADLFHETKNYLDEQAKLGKKVAIVAEVNQNLPYMYGDAVLDATAFNSIIDTKKYLSLFAIPREEVSIADHFIGLYTSALIKDGGCLQIGIGKLSNALANALIIRQKDNALYQSILKTSQARDKFSLIYKIGDVNPFSTGLYASTEMLSDEYLHLYAAGILKKKVYDHFGLQKAMNDGLITENISNNILDILCQNDIISENITEKDFKLLQKFGIFIPELRYQNHKIILPSGKEVTANINHPDLIQEGLGKQLSSGVFMHAGFLLGSKDLYQRLKEMPVTERRLINMTSIARTNQITIHPELLRLQRQDARFVNSSLMIALNGAIISHALENHQELSGVGGQFDFVYMATQIPGSYSIINCRSTRETKRGVQSNIVWQYPNITIPAFLRDVVVTEYGIADCRSKTDAEVIKELLNITDSRFQSRLLKIAKKAGKIEKEYQIPEKFKHNFPQSLTQILIATNTQTCFPPYPFGSDLTKTELALAGALVELKNKSSIALAILVIKSLFSFQKSANTEKYLERMKLSQPRTFAEFIYKKLISYLMK